MTKLMTITAAKGGVGKTTIANNYSAWLAQHGKKVLMFDLDESCNLSHNFNVYAQGNNNEEKKIYTVGELFRPNDESLTPPTIHHVGENLDLISGDLQLDQIQNKILSESDHNQRIFKYLRFLIQTDHFDYDYVIFDCHQNFNVATCNAIFCSHMVLSPITPDENGYNAKFEVSRRLEHYEATGDRNPVTNEPLIKAVLKFIGDKIETNTTLSRELLNVIQDDEQVIGYIPKREAFNQAAAVKQDIFTYLNHKERVTTSQRKFLVTLGATFTKLTHILGDTPDVLFDQIKK